MPPSIALKMLYGASERGQLHYIDLALSTGVDINTPEMVRQLSRASACQVLE